jgi:hypothetical protein
MGSVFLCAFEVVSNPHAGVLSGSTRLPTTWQQHMQMEALQQQNQQQQHTADGGGKETPVQVMVLQPGNEFAIGTQLSTDTQAAIEFRRGVLDREIAAKAVDEASSREAAQQTSSS